MSKPAKPADERMRQALYERRRLSERLTEEQDHNRRLLELVCWIAAKYAREHCGADIRGEVVVKLVRELGVEAEFWRHKRQREERRIAS